MCTVINKKRGEARVNIINNIGLESRGINWNSWLLINSQIDKDILKKRTVLMSICVVKLHKGDNTCKREDE